MNSLGGVSCPAPINSLDQIGCQSIWVGCYVGLKKKPRKGWRNINKKFCFVFDKY